MNIRMRRSTAAALLSTLLALAHAGCDSSDEIPTDPHAGPDSGLTDAALTLDAEDFRNPSADSWAGSRLPDVTELISDLQVEIGTLLPSDLTVTLSPGTTVTEDKTANLPPQADVVDIVFAFDITGSMGGELDNLKVNAVDIMTSLAGLIGDVRFGLVSFADYVGFYQTTGAAGGCEYAAFYGGTGDVRYSVDQSLSSDIDEVADAIAGLALQNGVDFPESYATALYELTQELFDNTGPEGPVDWRPQARRIVILFGDAIPHACDVFGPVDGQLSDDDREFISAVDFDDTGLDPGRDGTIGTSDDVIMEDVLEDLQEAEITLISLHSNQADEITSVLLEVNATVFLWSYYAEQTGGTNFVINTDGSFPEGTDIVQTILDLVGEQITTVDELILDVCPGDEAFADWISLVTPPSYTDIELPADREFDLVLGPPLGTSEGTYDFGICAIGDGAVLGSQNVSITVPGDEEPSADLAIQKSSDVTGALVGDTITWTISIENAGPDAATNVVLTDVLPSGVTLLTDLSAICTIDSGVATCALGDLPSGGSVEIEVLTTVDEAGTPVNAVEIASDVADPDESDNSSSAEVSVAEPGEPSADLSIQKSSDVTGALVGDTITWTITVENAGPDEATNVVLTDVLPSGVTLLTDLSAICTIDSGVATCALGDLPAGGSVEIEVLTTADEAGTPVNAVEITSDVADPDTGNTSSAAEVIVTEPPQPGECVVIDFETSGPHLATVSSFALGESTITITVEPGGPRSQAVAAIYDTDTVGGPDPDLEWDGGTCADCAGQGNVLMIADIGIATGGDSEDGGVIVLTGFQPGGYGFASIVAVDSDAKAYEVLVDGTVVGGTTPGADGNVQEISLATNVIESAVRIDLDRDSGAVDDLEFCPAGN